MKRRNSSNFLSDLRGVANLSTDAIIGITNLVESVHGTIASNAVEHEAPEPLRTRGITGFVYGNIRTVTKLAGGGIDLLLAQIGATIGEQESPPAREAILAVANGVFGDYLVAKNNPLAIPMQLRQDGQVLDDDMLAEAIQLSKGKVAIMLHGLCMNDLHLQRRGHDHGAMLARDLGYAPLYVRYNSGRHVSENGRDLAILLEQINGAAAVPLEIVMIGFSMGGLVARSACACGEMFGHRWLKQLTKLLFIGTPHHGALLERGGNWIDRFVDINAYSAPFARLGKIRSAGFTDLRYGNVVDGDWRGRDRFQSSGDQRTIVPLPGNVACYAAAGTRISDSGKLADELIGDGLVTVDSALGNHTNPDLDLGIPESQKWTGRGMSHLDLLNHAQVYEIIKKWVR